MKIKGCRILEDYDLKKLTTYKLAGTTSYLASPNDTQALIRLIKHLRNNKIKYKIIGGGSNLIFKDNYNGVLIRLDKFDKLEINCNRIVVGAGYNTIKLSKKVMREDLTGFEFASGIYGTIGGAIFNNAGAYKSDMGYVVLKAKVLTPDLQIINLSNNEMKFHYRTSFFKKNPEYICLEATLQLSIGKKEEIKHLMLDRKKTREETQPVEKPCAGSVFRNPENTSSWKLIDEIGYKGKVLGGAKVSEKHANFIINDKNAKGEDIINLINQIKEKVKKEKGIDLILEQEIVE